MSRIIFCNIGWMSRYKGLDKQADKIVGGGSYVRENATGGEVCNFLGCADGNVYGHVETIQGDTDRQIHIEKFGALEHDDMLSGITLVWVATHPTEKGRRVVGWYQNATIFRHRQYFDQPPSKQHKKDNIGSYRVRALTKDMCVLDVDERILSMPNGKGWLGQTPWWSPESNSSIEVSEFVQSVRQLIQSTNKAENAFKTGEQETKKAKSPGTAKASFQRYIQEYETTIHPKHHKLQERFEKFLSTNGATEIQSDRNSVDVQFQDVSLGHTLAEIKPCDKSNARFAIRTAMGQLLDYQQRTDGDPSLLVVIEVMPTKEDKALAVSNGIGIAYPNKNEFTIVWPKNHQRER